MEKLWTEIWPTSLTRNALLPLDPAGACQEICTEPSSLWRLSSSALSCSRSREAGRQMEKGLTGHYTLSSQQLTQCGAEQMPYIYHTDSSRLWTWVCLCAACKDTETATHQPVLQISCWIYQVYLERLSSYISYMTKSRTKEPLLSYKYIGRVWSIMDKMECQWIIWQWKS